MKLQANDWRRSKVQYSVFVRTTEMDVEVGFTLTWKEINHTEGTLLI